MYSQVGSWKECLNKFLTQIAYSLGHDLVTCTELERTLKTLCRDCEATQVPIIETLIQVALSVHGNAKLVQELDVLIGDILNMQEVDQTDP